MPWTILTYNWEENQNFGVKEKLLNLLVINWLYFPVCILLCCMFEQEEKHFLILGKTIWTNCHRLIALSCLCLFVSQIWLPENITLHREKSIWNASFFFDWSYCSTQVLIQNLFGLIKTKFESSTTSLKEFLAELVLSHIRLGGQT